MVKKTYAVQGMHCSSCEIFIENTVRKIKGIKEVEVYLGKAEMVIEANSPDSLPSLRKLNQLFNKNGYYFSTQKNEKSTGISIKEYLFAGAGFIFIVIIFFLANRSRFFSGLYVDSNSNFAAYLIFGVAAEISSCAALVGGLLLSVQESWADLKNHDNQRSFLPFFLFNFSRIITFALLGGILGALGSLVKLSIKASAVLTVMITIVMIIIGLQMLGIKSFQRISLNFSGKIIKNVTTMDTLRRIWMPILFGAITFFIPCGFTLIAQSQALRTGSFVQGMLILTAFSLGTLPMLLFISYSSVKLFQNLKFARIYRIFSGMLIVFFAIITLNSQFGILRIPNLADSAKGGEGASLMAPEINNPNSVPTSQVMQMEVKGFEYFPKTITIKAGIPTEFEITDNGSIGCARAVFARGLYEDVILLEPGKNSVEFISPEAGVYQISCSMWMVEPITVIVE